MAKPVSLGWSVVSCFAKSSHISEELNKCGKILMCTFVYACHNTENSAHKMDVSMLSAVISEYKNVCTSGQWIKTIYLFWL